MRRRCRTRRRDIKALLRQRHQLRGDAGDDFNIENPSDVLSAREGATRTLGFLLIAVASVSLIVGGISIMNIMLVSVTERTREIGLRMAVGARRRDIRRQFLIEAVTLALIGGLIGALIGSAGAMAIAWQAEWPILISPWAIVLACGFSGLVGIAFGFYPAYRASSARSDGRAALRVETASDDGRKQKRGGPAAARELNLLFAPYGSWPGAFARLPQSEELLSPVAWPSAARS